MAVSALSQLGWLSGCGSSAPSGGPAAGDLDVLASALDGRLVRPPDRGFAAAGRLFNPRFDAIRPTAIAFCDTPEDVRRALAFGREHDMRLTARGGRHSYAGYSVVEGLVVDVSPMDEIRVDADAGVARIGAGAQLIDVYAGLARHGVTIPAGSCPSVGISGLTLGGGFGLSSRKLGLTSDSLRAVDLVTAAGDVVTADEREEADLFWACRGGGGGNFGVATSFEFDVHPVSDVAIYDFQWRWEDARAVVEAWQDLAPTAPDELFSILKLAKASADPGREPAKPVVSSYGQFFGSESDLEALLEPLVAAGRPVQRKLDRMRFLDAQSYWAGCEDPGDRCAAAAERLSYKAKSQYVAEPFPAEAIETMIRRVEAWPGSASSEGGAIQMDASGGAIGRVPPEDTAFVHRDDLFHCQYLAFWGNDDPRRVVDANLDWIADFFESMSGYGSGAAYQNYIDPELGGWEQAYYGSNLGRLMEIRARYDPDGIFDFRQSIPRAT